MTRGGRLARTGSSARAAAAAALATAGCSALIGLEELAFDGAAPDDAGSDARPVGEGDADADAGPRSRCADGLVHDFCDDFEDVAIPQARWTGIELVGTGKLDLVPQVDAPSPPTVLRSAIDIGPDGGTEVHIARLSLQDAWPRTQGGGQPRVRVSFRVLAEGLRTKLRGETVGFVVLGRAPGGPIEDTLALVLGPDLPILRLEETYADEDAGVVFAGRDLPFEFLPDKWYSVSLEVNERPPGVNGGAVVTVDGESVSYPLQSSSRAATFRFDIGASVGTFEGASRTFRYDDVMVDYR
jgi:hypothetical protein